MDVTIYDNLDPARLSAGGNDPDRLRQDTAALFLPTGLFRTNLRHGLGITWQLQPITYEGSDANGNPRLRFTVYGTDEDVETFWDDFWAYCEQQDISCASCFDGHLRDTLLETDGAVWGELSPVEYFLANFLKANAVIIAIDANRLSVAGRNAMHLLATYRAAIPAHVHLFVIERQTLPNEEYDMGADVADAVTPVLVTPLAEVAGPDEFYKARMSYNDPGPVVYWLPVCQGENDDEST